MAYLRRLPDGGESTPRMHYVTGLGSNAVLKRLASEIEAEARRHYARGDRAKVLRFHSVFYQAGTWPHPRRVGIKVEVTDKGVNTRFIVTDLLRAGAQWLYQRVYCARGQIENYSPSRQVGIKDHKRGLKSDRTSCYRFEANAFRLFLHSAAYVLLWTLRAEVLEAGLDFIWGRVSKKRPKRSGSPRPAPGQAVAGFVSGCLDSAPQFFAVRGLARTVAWPWLVR